MAMRELSKRSDYKKFTFKSIGDKIEGEYLGSETFDYKGKPLTMYKFKDSEGEVVATIGGFRLNEILPGLPVGSFTRIEYVKEIKTGSGGTLKDFKVLYEEPSGL